MHVQTITYKHLCVSICRLVKYQYETEVYGPVRCGIRFPFKTLAFVYGHPVFILIDECLLQDVYTNEHVYNASEREFEKRDVHSCMNGMRMMDGYASLHSL